MQQIIHPSDIIFNSGSSWLSGSSRTAWHCSGHLGCSFPQCPSAQPNPTCYSKCLLLLTWKTNMVTIVAAGYTSYAVDKPRCRWNDPTTAFQPPISTQMCSVLVWATIYRGLVFLCGSDSSVKVAKPKPAFEQGPLALLGIRAELGDFHVTSIGGANMPSYL